ncbi:Pseudouridine-5'-phosphatase [Tritrichomonas musculus]|uniref:Pseudouridine-5'-phosphatase n=1 Tax=Tritrichomonas musculus TaxID=1915356 RepID=A0ABR2HX19_9EUKA
MSVWPHPIKAVIFDCDGTILDTLPIYFQTNDKILGFKYPRELSKQTCGKSEIEICRIIVNHFNLPMTPQEYLDKRNEILNDTLPNSELIPHVDDLIKKLKSMGLKMSVATSSFRRLHELKTKNHRDLFSLFDYEICGDDVKNAKPAPDSFLLAASKMCCLKPENVLVFEDATTGVKAANNANMPVVVYHKDNEDFRSNLESNEAKPTVILEKFENFDYSLFNWQP